jgi:hypothetical protein
VTFATAFAERIYAQKYSHERIGGLKEKWSDTAERQARCVVRPYLPDLESLVREAILQRQFMPGGRYLYAAGRKYHQVNNCFLFDVEDSRDSWAELGYNVRQSLMTGGGVGVVYSKVREENAYIHGMGGRSTGPCALMNMTNEEGRYIRQGGSRRSAIWAGLLWSHADCFKFIHMKDWSDMLRRCKSEDYNFPLPMDGTNISVILDDHFFTAYYNPAHEKHKLAHTIYWEVIRQMMQTGEPGFSVDVGENSGEHLRNAPVCGDTHVLTGSGYQPVSELVGVPTTVWTGKQWVNEVVFNRTAVNTQVVKVSMTGGRGLRCEPSHPFLVERWAGKGSQRKLLSIDRVTAADLQAGDTLHVSLPTLAPSTLSEDAYTLGYLYGDGSFTTAGGAEVTFCTREKHACLGVVLRSSRISSVTENDSRGYDRCYFSVDHDYFDGRTKDVFPVEMYTSTTEDVCSFLAGLFDADGNWEPEQRRIRLSSNHVGFLRGVARLLEQLGIIAGVSSNGRSTYGGKQTFQLVVMSQYAHRFAELIPTQRLQPNLDGYRSYRPSQIKVVSVEPDGTEDVYCCDVGVPEHSFMAEGVIISNCTEVTSSDNLDMCNLGSINMAKVDTLERFVELVELGTAFLLCGTLYSKLPIPRMYAIREKNRRIGLGLMGVHEWLLKRGYRYGPCCELDLWMRAYEMSTSFAFRLGDKLGISRPCATRSIAPTGTISIVGEATSGIEPVFAVAYKRRFLDQETWKAEYVIDATAGRLIECGVDPALIEDAYTLAEDYERRIDFQTYMQQHVDHGISSTINLPQWGTSLNNEDRIKPFGEALIKRLPTIRGITTYPDGSRGGQPLNRVSYAEAVKHIGTAFVETADTAYQSMLDDEVMMQGGSTCANGFCNS